MVDKSTFIDKLILCWIDKKEKDFKFDDNKNIRCATNIVYTIFGASGSNYSHVTFDIITSEVQHRMPNIAYTARYGQGMALLFQGQRFLNSKRT